MRNSRNRVLCLTAFLFVPAASTALAAAETYKVDNVHSCVIFRIKHLNVAFFYGRFNEFSGQFVFDDAAPSKSMLDIVVKADSIDTNNDARDQHVKGPEFFDVATYPELKFKSVKVESAGTDKLKVTGEMTMHGLTKLITVDLERTGQGNDPWGSYRAGFETVFTIKRTEFGMTNMLGGLSDEVKLTISIEGVRQ